MIGQTIQNIEIKELLGKGGMGTVYKGVDIMLHRDVAIKVLHPELLYDEQVTKRFQAEAIMLASLNHSNITSLYNLIKQDSNYLMVMEFVEGRSLDDLLKDKKRFTEEEAIEYTLQALEGLKHAHAKKIIHRDLKLANIMVSSEGTVKIMDFGIARVLGSSRLTSAGRVIGTLEYMSPEQVQGQEGDERSDIYALGTVLYELVSGRVPFKSASEYDLMTTKINQKPPPIRSFVEASSALESILSKAMDRNPKQRFQTAEQFRKALIEYREKNLSKVTKPGLKEASAAALLKLKSRIPVSGKGKPAAGKETEKGAIAPLPGFYRKNKRILLQGGAALLVCILFFGTIHKIRQNRLSGKAVQNEELPVDNKDGENRENQQADQGTMIYPETPKINPDELPKTIDNSQKREKPEERPGNQDTKSREDKKVNENATRQKAAKKDVSESERDQEKNESQAGDAKIEESKKTSKQGENEGVKKEETGIDETKEEVSKADQTKEKIESVSKKINETGSKILKDFKEILFDEDEDAKKKEKEQEQAKEDEKKKIEEKKQEPQTVYVQAYTTIYVRLSEDVSSENAKKGQQVKLTVDKDVLADGLVAIPGGQIFNGVITDVRASEGLKKGMLELSIQSINLPGAQSVPLRASTFRIMGEKDEEASFQRGQTFEVQTAQRSKIILGG